MKTKKFSQIIKGLREHVVMRNFTTFHVGGVADYFVEAKTIDELVKAVRSALNYKIPYFVLGGGSNILFSDYGFPGLVIKNATSQVAVMKENSQVIADSGVMLGKLIMELTASDLGGLEFLYGVPGTVGGALYGNAGAWGSAIGDYLKLVTVLEVDPENGLAKINQHDASWMEFGYRDSKLKRTKINPRPIILTAKFQFSHCQKEEIMRRLNASREKRQASQPVGFSAGSIFRNPIPEELKNVTGRGSKNMPEFTKERTAGFMLEQVGAKKMKVGSAEVSTKHANFIINKKNGASSAEIRSLIEALRDRVGQKYGLILEEEIEYVGQW